MDSRAQADDAVKIVWEPQPGPQTALLACPVFEIFYGGARGGGKTDGMLGEWADHADQYGQDANGVFFRRSLIQLDETIERSKEIYRPLGAEWREQKKTWKFPGGARLKFRPLERDGDAERYQGHSYTRVYLEEMTNFPDPVPVMKLKATLRSAAGVPVGFRGTGNPGGPGHQWVKARYIDPAPRGYAPIQDEDTGLHRVYIPAKVADNPALLGSDPHYVSRLKDSGSKELVRAWLDGDWDTVLGAYFDCWRNDMPVVEPVPLPDYWTRFRAFDWGSARPFCCLWFAVSDGKLPQFPRGAVIVYREWYGAKEPNVGLKLDVEEVARGIAERQGKEKITFSRADPSIFAEDGGPSLAFRMQKAAKVSWAPADNTRLAGWDQVRQRLIGEDDMPMLYVFSTCVHLIRTLPVLQHDELRPEDLDTKAEDHAADALRYGLMSYPYVKDRPMTEEEKRLAAIQKRRKGAYSLKKISRGGLTWQAYF
jgi:hypothetical protein